MSMGSAAHGVRENPVLVAGARVGYAASGVLHLMLAWLALQLAWGSSGQEADQTGALQALAGTTPGSALLWVLVVGFALLGLWHVTEAVVRTGAGVRAKAAAKAAAYLVLAWTTMTVLQGSARSGSEQSASLAAGMMRQPGGRLLVGLLGLAIIGVGAYHVVKGWRRTFLEDLRERPSRAVVRAAVIGYVAKGVALAVVGGLVVTAAVQADPDDAQGLDGALRTLLELPLGPVLVTLVAVGLAAYGAYSFARARYARV